MNPFFKKLFFVAILFFATQIIYSQNRRIADSLTLEYLNFNGSALEESQILYQIILNHSNADSILKYANKLVIKAEVAGDNTLLLRGYYYKASAHKHKGNFHQALSNFFSSAAIAKKIECNSCVSAAYLAIGSVYTASFDSKNAISYYNKAIELSKIDNDSLSQAGAFLNAGGEYLHLNEIDSAKIYFTNSKKLFNALGNEIGVAYSKGNLGKIYSKLNKLVLAEKYITEAIDILEVYNDSYALSIYYRYLSEIYKKRNEFKPSLELAEISLKIANQGNLLPEIGYAYELLTELYARNGNLDKAFESQSNYIAIRDSINNEETIRKMADLRTEYEVAQKQAEVDLLNKKRQNQRLIVIGLFIVLALTGGIFLVHYYNSRKRKQLNKKLVQRQEELQKQHDQLERLNKTKDRFFSIISHDLRGPINVLNGTTLLIRDFLDSKNYEELDELTANMEYSVKKVQNLLDNLLEWAVSQQGEFPYKPEILSMDDVCDNVLNIFIAMAATKSIELTYEIKPDAQTLIADKNSLMTIIRNLVSNAMKFTNQNGTVKILAESADSNYCITVSDNGIGIPDEKQENLFKIIENKSTWGTAKEKGLGIGLSLVHEFVKMHKGTITVDSTVGVGTSFKIYLPQDEIIQDA
jgi:signal transduction histidine kinase